MNQHFDATSDIHSMLRESVERYCAGAYDFRSRMARVAEPEGFSRKTWQEFAGMGWLGTFLPESVGGLGGSIDDAFSIARGLGAALVAEPYASAGVLAPRLIEKAVGADAGAERLARIVAGDLVVALAYEEEGTRGDIARIAASATRDGEHFMLSGSKIVAPAGGADEFVLVLRTAEQPGDRKGLSLFVVPRAEVAQRRTDYRAIDGSVHARLDLEGMRVSAGSLLGQEGEAFEPLSDAIDHGTLALCAEAVGMIEAVLAMTRDYVTTRTQFGEVLARYQAIRHGIADMAIDLNQAAAMLAHGTAALGLTGAAREKGVSAAKAYIGTAVRKVAAAGVQYHGAIGVTEEHAISHFYKRALAIEALCGDSGHHRARYARLMRQDMQPAD